MMPKKIKPLAIYLPQYHPIKENDEWWGKGFTEWTNVTKAQPLFKKHEQPKFPADLGYYDLRVSDVREQQAEMAKAYGIHGFVYYHYWFGNGKMLLERPFKEVLESKKPDFPFCLCWANQTWSGIWHGAPNKVLIEQLYPGSEDIEMHFNYLLKAFTDDRYIRVDDKPVFIVYDVAQMTNVGELVEKFNELAIHNGLKGIYFMGSNISDDDWDFKGAGFDGKISNAFNKSFNKFTKSEKLVNIINNRVSDYLNYSTLRIVDHQKISNDITYINSNVDTYPIVLPNWDNTPRSGNRGVVLENSSPTLFSSEIKKGIKFIEENDLPENFLFIKSWNEWAEGNYLEPDTSHGFGFLDSIKDNIVL